MFFEGKDGSRLKKKKKKDLEFLWIMWDLSRASHGGSKGDTSSTDNKALELVVADRQLFECGLLFWIPEWLDRC